MGGKQCPECKNLAAVAKKICQCGHVFLERKRRGFQEMPIVITSERLRFSRSPLVDSRPVRVKKHKYHGSEYIYNVSKPKEDGGIDINDKTMEQSQLSMEQRQLSMDGEHEGDFDSSDGDDDNETKSGNTALENIAKEILAQSKSDTKASNNEVLEKLYPKRERIKTTRYEDYFVKQSRRGSVVIGGLDSETTETHWKEGESSSNKGSSDDERSFKQNDEKEKQTTNYNESLLKVSDTETSKRFKIENTNNKEENSTTKNTLKNIVKENTMKDVKVLNTDPPKRAYTKRKSTGNNVAVDTNILNSKYIKHDGEKVKESYDQNNKSLEPEKDISMLALKNKQKVLSKIESLGKMIQSKKEKKDPIVKITNTGETKEKTMPSSLKNEEDDAKVPIEFRHILKNSEILVKDINAVIDVVTVTSDDLLSPSFASKDSSSEPVSEGESIYVDEETKLKCIKIPRNIQERLNIKTEKRTASPELDDVPLINLRRSIDGKSNSSSTSSSINNDHKSKRPVGRPRKNPPTDNKLKRPVGRPKKVHVEAVKKQLIVTTKDGDEMEDVVEKKPLKRRRPSSSGSRIGNGDGGHYGNGDSGSGDGGRGDIGRGDIGPGDIGPDDIGPDDIGPGDIGPGDIGPGDIGPGDIGPGDIGSGDIGPGDIGPGDIGPGDTGPGDIGPGDIGLGDIDHGDIGSHDGGRSDGDVARLPQIPYVHYGEQYYRHSDFEDDEDGDDEADPDYKSPKRISLSSPTSSGSRPDRPGRRCFLSPPQLIACAKMERMRNVLLETVETERLKKRLTKKSAMDIPDEKKELYSHILDEINRRIVSQSFSYSLC